MLSIAVISDIHANLPALEAVLADLDTIAPDQIYCLGDLVDFAPWPNEVINRIRALRIPVIMGNHDERIAFDIPVVPLQKHSAAETAARLEAIAITRSTISQENKQFLASLPAHIRLQFGTPEKPLSVLLVHASPRNIDEYIYADHDPAVLWDMLEAHQADVLIGGHTHLSYIRELHGKKNGAYARKLVINAGSVGRSKEDNPAATYLLLQIDHTVAEKPVMIPVIRKVPYAVEVTATGIRESKIPDFYAAFLQRH
ncbi:metallophosphoesterase family protein [Chitinophaga nivalis]|uniref:Metallophosphoesterase family protein n=1 Tax=Chitinophaga nivalis TaxID=2991709 RepID=A0ABT3IHX7_9BACT|nr:metallophosphoesterase family protein [Chitinophaga nivalis]MCW3466739.1 metallophosphoesterase family protein [Chitinophaga nivalis]MCW3483570.1 metallophosphoesterase family protein [Chitinophaga nivalis]